MAEQLPQWLVDTAIVDSIRDALSGDKSALAFAFIWELTPERHEYWERIYYHGVDDEARARLEFMLAQVMLVYPDR